VRSSIAISNGGGAPPPLAIAAGPLALLATAAPATPADAAAQQQEEAKALDTLKVEPPTDEERAAKFLIFETFSDKVQQVRAALDEVARTAQTVLPSLPKQGLAKQMKDLDGAANAGIFDQNRAGVWFVYEMAKKSADNALLIARISSDVSRKMDFLASQAQPNCPMCLSAFEPPDAPAPEDPEADRCVPLVLSCCHSVCGACWNQWQTLRGANVCCPLCRGAEFHAGLFEGAV